MQKYLLVFSLSVIFTLTGCQQELKDGYQVGDITHFNARKLAAIHNDRVAYCSAYSTTKIRQIALAAIRAQYPLIPKDGICFGLRADGIDQTLLQHRIRDVPCNKSYPTNNHYTWGIK